MNWPNPPNRGIGPHHGVDENDEKEIEIHGVRKRSIWKIWVSVLEVVVKDSLEAAKELEYYDYQ